MDLIFRILVLIIVWLCNGLVIGPFLYWKKEHLKDNKWMIVYLLFLGLFLVIDIIITILGGIPGIISSITVYLIGSQIRSDELPNAPKFVAFFKVYIIILSVSLIPGLMFAGYSLLVAFPPIDFVPAAMGMAFAPLIIPLIIFIGSDPTNRYGQREPNRLLGCGFAFVGWIIGMVFGYLLAFSKTFLLLDLLTLLFLSLAVASAALICLSLVFGNT